MALYAIGDVQGCDDELGALLDALRFLAGSGSAVVRRRSRQSRTRLARRSCGASALWATPPRSPSGNHDLHLLAVAYGARALRSGDTLSEILAAPDRDALLDWLLDRPLLHEDRALNLCLLHAGLAPQWDWPSAQPLRPRIRAALCAAIPERAVQPDVRRPSRIAGTSPRRRRAPALHRQLLHAPALRDAEGRLMLRAKGSPKKIADCGLDPMVRGARSRVARTTHRLRALVDPGFLQRRRCHRARHGMRLGRQPDGPAAGRTGRRAGSTCDVARRGRSRLRPPGSLPSRSARGNSEDLAADQDTGCRSA